MVNGSLREGFSSKINLQELSMPFVVRKIFLYGVRLDIVYNESAHEYMNTLRKLQLFTRFNENICEYFQNSNQGV